MTFGGSLKTRDRYAVAGIAAITLVAASWMLADMESPTAVKYMVQHEDGSQSRQVLDLGEENAAPGVNYAKPGAMSICAKDASVVRITVALQDHGMVESFTCP